MLAHQAKMSAEGKIVHHEDGMSIFWSAREQRHVKARYPVPAIVLSVEFTEWHDDTFWIYELSIWNVSDIDQPELAAIWHKGRD